MTKSELINYQIEDYDDGSRDYSLEFKDTNYGSKFSICINSIDKNIKTCNVNVKKWMGGYYSGYLYQRNFKKRKIDIIFDQIKHLIDYEK